MRSARPSLPLVLMLRWYSPSDRFFLRCFAATSPGLLERPRITCPAGVVLVPFRALLEGDQETGGIMAMEEGLIPALYCSSNALRSSFWNLHRLG